MTTNEIKKLIDGLTLLDLNVKTQRAALTHIINEIGLEPRAYAKISNRVRALQLTVTGVVNELIDYVGEGEFQKGKENGPDVQSDPLTVSGCPAMIP